MPDTRTEAEKLTAAILYRRYRKCIAAGDHTENCQRCGHQEGMKRG